MPNRNITVHSNEILKIMKLLFTNMSFYIDVSVLAHEYTKKIEESERIT